MLDRIDIHVEVTPVNFDELIDKEEREGSEQIRKRVISTRKVQHNQFHSYKKIHNNAQMSSKLIREYCQLDASSEVLLKKAMEKLELSARAYDRILKVARTIADLEGSENILKNHIAEAIQFRSLDRANWAG